MTTPAVAIRDRVIASTKLPASQLVPHPLNWRTHPQGQRSALRAAVEGIGYTTPLIVRPHPNGDPHMYEILDGHLRVDELGGDFLYPATVTDLDDREAMQFLMEHDTISTMAGVERQNLQSLLEQAPFENEHLALMMGDLAASLALPIVTGGDGDAGDGADGGEQFGNFSGADPNAQVVDFKFGDYRGLVSRAMYDRFVARYQEVQTEAGEVMLDDVLRTWLRLVDRQADREEKASDQAAAPEEKPKRRRRVKYTE